MTQSVKRACDACHRRKVKCDGIHPCRNCSSAQLSCTYNAIPQKKGPKGSRAKVISELRETQRQTSLMTKVYNRVNGIPDPPESANGIPTAGMLGPEFVKDCVDFYFANLYEKIPILDHRSIEQQLPFMEQNRDLYCLLTSLCAFVMLQPGMSLPPGDACNLEMMPGTSIISSQVLLEESLRVRMGSDYLESPNLTTLATSFFLFACHHGIALHDKAWFYLREATTVLHMIGMNKEETYAHWDTVESSRRRRLYWLFFVLERSHAIQRQRPLTLQATIKPPSSQDDPSDPQAHQLNDFVMLVKLFHSFDDALTGTWLKTRGTLSSQHATNLQKQLNEILPSYLCQDGQLAELQVNQQWIKTTHWQLTNSRINSSNGDGIDWNMPQDLSRELRMKMAAHFPGQGTEMLQSGLMEQLLDICCNMTDYLATQPASRDPFSVGPREQLNQVLNIVGVLRHGTYQFLPLLFSKIHDMLPRLTDPMLQNAPENSNLGSIDIFDGFGNAGMAQPPAQMHMQMDADYDRKFSVAEYEKFSEMNGISGSDSNTTATTGGAPSMQTTTSSDSNSPFASSPSVMSPGVEFPRHDINGFCTPMQEMVMSPMGDASSMNGQQQQQQQQQQHPPQHPPQQHHQSHQAQPHPQSQHQYHQQRHHLMQNQYMTPIQTNLGQHHGAIQQGHGFGTPTTPSQPQPGMNTASMPPSTGHHSMADTQDIGSSGGTTGSMINQMQHQAAPSQQQQQPPPPPPRANSFAMSGGQIPRTVGDFHALQRSNTGDLSAMSGIATAEMDFGGMR